MKQILIALTLLAFTGCTTSDKEIKADIAGKAQQDMNFSGLSYTVKNGIVNFTGRCPSEKAFSKIKQTVKNIHVIKGVNYRVSIAPVLLDTLTPVKLQVDSVLGSYPQVTAMVTPIYVTLKGSITATAKTKLIKSLNTLHLNSIKDSLTTTVD